MVIYDHDQLLGSYAMPFSRAAGHVGKPGRRERNKREKLERITQAASDLFREQGFEQTTGRQICERADIGTGTLFLYVKDKRELLSLIFQPRARQTFARLPCGLGRNESLLDALMRVFGAFFRLYGQDPEMSRFFVQDLLFRNNDNPGLVMLDKELQARVAALVRDAQERQMLRSDLPVEEAGLAFLAHYTFWLQLWLGSGNISRHGAIRGLRSALQIQIDGAGEKKGSEG